MRKIIFSCICMSALAVFGCEKIEEGKIEAKVGISALDYDDSTVVKVLFSPNEATARFEYAIGLPEDIDAFSSGAMPGILSVDGNSELEASFTGLDPSSIYSVYARPYDRKGNSGGISVLKVSTADSRFKAELQYVLDVSAGFRLSMTEEIYQCRYYLGKASDRDSFLSGEIEGGYCTEVLEYECVNYFNLDPETEYVFFAVAEDRRGAETRLWEIPIRTFSPGECPNVSISSEIDVYQGTYSAVPNDLCGRVILSVSESGTVQLICPTGFYNDLVLMLDSWSTTNFHTFESYGGTPVSMTMVTSRMLNDQPVDLYVSIYDKNDEIAGIKYFPLSTPSFDEGLEIPNPVNIEISGITSAGAVYGITADQTALGYFYETVEADWYDDLKERDPGMSEYFLAETFLSNYSENNATGYLHYGNGSYTWAETSGLPDFRYYAAAVPFNANGPREGGWGKTALVEYRTLPE